MGALSSLVAAVNRKTYTLQLQFQPVPP